MGNLAQAIAVKSKQSKSQKLVEFVEIAVDKLTNTIEEKSLSIQMVKLEHKKALKIEKRNHTASVSSSDDAKFFVPKEALASTSSMTTYVDKYLNNISKSAKDATLFGESVSELEKEQAKEITALESEISELKATLEMLTDDYEEVVVEETTED